MGTIRLRQDYSQLTAGDYASLSSYSDNELRAEFYRLLNKGMNGICFSLYEDGQSPGDVISEAQVRRRMSILKPHTDWVRSFSCTEGNEHIPIIAKEMGLRTLVGAWLGDDPEINKREIDGLLTLAREGYVDIAAVGNEVMYREDLTEGELLEHMRYVKQNIGNIPVGYVDAYYEFTERPAITEMCDVILTNCYPFWEGCPMEYSLAHMQSMYHQAKEAGAGKPVLITETGWPSQGESFEGSIPSQIHAMQYFVQLQHWAERDGIESFYFSSFDESWKCGAEGDVGAYWGIWDKNEQLKY